MKCITAKNLVGSLALVAGLTFSAVANAATVGNDPTHAGSQVDGCTQCAFVIGQAFSAGSGSVTSYSFFSGAQAGDITPILYTGTGSSFTITAIGASHTISSTTPQEYTFAFGLQSGSSLTSANTYFGFYNSTGSLVSFDYTTPNYVNGGAYAFQVATPTVGQTFAFSGSTQDAYNMQLSRLYSANATSTPEPSSLALLGTGIAGLGGLVKRRIKRS